MERKPDMESPYVPRENGGHIADYMGVLSRRFWLVLGIFGVTTATAIWAVGRQEEMYRASLSLQINDPIERGRTLVNRPVVSGLDLFSDPIESEMRVLRSTQLAAAVVRELGLSLFVVGADVPRSALIADAVIDEAAPIGNIYELSYREGVASLTSEGGSLLGRSPIGERLDAPAAGLSFVVRQPPRDGVWALTVGDARKIAEPISAAIAYRHQENTNVVDVSLDHGDPDLVDDILNALAEELREVGARKVATQAAGDIAFIEEQLDSAQADRSRIASDLRGFQQSEDFFSLTARERYIIDDAQRLEERISDSEQLATVLGEIGERVSPESAANLDYAAIEASLPEGSSPQVTQLLAELRQQRAEIQRLVDQGLGDANPRLRSARSGLRLLAEEFLEAVASRRAFVQGELEGLLADRSALAGERARFPDLQTTVSEYEQALQEADQLIAYLRGQLAEQRIRQAAAAPYIDVVDPAVGSEPTSSAGQLNIILGALLGLVLGIGAAFFLEYLDRTVRTSADIETLLGVPVLGIIPRLRRVEASIEEQVRGPKAPLLVAMDPLDPAAEAYRNLRMNLMFMDTPEDPIRSILFSSPGPNEGKSTTALNFAVMLAQQGERVLLIDADLRRPSLHRALDILREPGLTTLLTGDAETRRAIRPNVLPNLDILPSGPFPPNPSELLSSKAMARVIEEMAGKYAHVVIDCPPVLALTDAAVLAGYVDGAVLVLRSGETEQRAAERAVDQLRRLGTRVFGAVLNEVVVSGADDDYYMKYFYHYQPQQEARESRLRSRLASAKFW